MREKKQEKRMQSLNSGIFGTHSHTQRSIQLSIYTVTHIPITHIHRHKNTQTLPENNRKTMQLDGYFIFATFRCFYRCLNVTILWLISRSFN